MLALFIMIPILVLSISILKIRKKLINGERDYQMKFQELRKSPDYSVRPDGARHQWRKVPPRELSVDLVADERSAWVTGWVEAS